MMHKMFRSLYSWVVLVSVIIIVITANSFFMVRTLDQLANLEARLFTTNQIINSLSELHVAILSTESGQRGFLLTRDERYLEAYTLTLNRLNSLIDDLEVKSMASDFPDQADRIQNLLQLGRTKVNELIETVELSRKGQHEEALKIVNTDRGLQLYDQFETQYQKIEQSEREIQGQHLANLMIVRKGSVNTLIVSAVSTGLLIVAIFMLLKMNVRETFEHQAELEEINQELESKIEQRTQELLIYSEELTRSNRELEDFAFVASHDLQEPLRKIRAFGNRLESGYQSVMDERGKDFLQRMLNAAERMSMLISDLLAFSRVSTRGKDFEDVDLNEVVESVQSDLEIAIEDSEAQIQWEPLPVIQGDKLQIEQVFLNLLSNALKFRKADIAPKITISSQPATAEDLESFHLADEFDWVKIIVADNGIGFDQSFADKIFAPFQRLHGRSTYQGTGIGLAVCRRIIERHNGQIVAFSKPDQGSTFVITMPVNGEPFTASTSQGVVQNDA